MIRIIFLKLPWLLCGEWITEGRSGKLRARVGPAKPCRQRRWGAEVSLVSSPAPDSPGAHGLPHFAPLVRNGTSPGTHSVIL